MAQKERLSSLGRLSTVIAYEIRNPLMIIKAALHTLRQPGAGAAALAEAAADIDDEVRRLNRIVNDVLDFARPIEFELVAADLNLLCREWVAAAEASPGPPVRLDLDRALPPVLCDPERLRVALVNVLVNARQAVERRDAAVPALAVAIAPAGRPLPADGAAPGRADAGEPRVVLATRRAGDRALIAVSDNGAGIDRADLARVFEPYFTTRRGGTGLGLAIAKNIVEGLGGAIAVESAKGRGTEMRIELPLARDGQGRS
jgi:two-component system sensor histidine kinase HydH